MNKRIDIEELKRSYIDKEYGTLLILDVIRENSGVYFVCKCKCGNIKNILYRSVLHGHSKSCGCRSNVATRISLDKLKSEYIGKVYNKLTVTDVFRNENGNHHILMFRCKCECGRLVDIPKKSFHKNPPVSCGCYRYTKEYTEKQLQWRKLDRDKVALTNKKISEWYSSNPDKVKERVASWRNAYNKNRTAIMETLRAKHSDKRTSIIEHIDTSFIHQDDLHLLYSGSISNVQVRTKCPLCGNYEYHRLYHVINYKDHYTIERFCSKCAVSFSSSKYEQEIADYISTFYNGGRIRNNRTILNGKELDLYFPEKKIAIEFNGDYWHNENHKPKDYHYNKFKSCLDKGIILVSIFESEWNNHSEDIKKYLFDLFNSKDTDLSFVKEGYMNNNYPSFKCLESIVLGDVIEDSYIFKDSLVYTCGYSKIINNN